MEGDVGGCDQVGRAHPHVALDQCDPGARGQVGRAGARPDDREQAAGPLEGLRLLDPGIRIPNSSLSRRAKELAVAEVVAEHVRDVNYTLLIGVSDYISQENMEIGCCSEFYVISDQVRS